MNYEDIYGMRRVYTLRRSIVNELLGMIKKATVVWLYNRMLGSVYAQLVTKECN